MRRIAILFLLLCLPAWAAFTERYVSVAGAGAHNGSVGGEWTLAEAFAGAATGDRVNILSGNYSSGAVTLSAAGTAVSNITYRGYASSIGDLDSVQRGATGTLVTTNFPVITCTGIIQSLGYTNFKNLSFTGALSSVLLGNTTADDWGLISCSVLNTQNNAAAACVGYDNTCYMIDCDVSCTGAAHGTLIDADAQFTMIGCRLKATANSNFVSPNDIVAINNVFIGNAATPIGAGLYINVFSGGTNPVIHGNTFLGLVTAISLPNEAPGGLIPFIGNNHITDCTTYLNNRYSATASTAVVEYFNRTRDNGTARTGIGDGVLQAEIASGATGDTTTDFVNPATADYHLLFAAPGTGLGIMGLDIGAHSYRTTPPTAASVFVNSGNGGFDQ